MRIAIIGPPKAGNWWIKQMLATTYDLRVISGSTVPARGADFVDWVEGDGWRDGTIFHHHYGYDPAITRAAAAIGAPIVTPIRDPYDGFVSFYHAIQRAPDRFTGTGTVQEGLIGKPIDHPDVLAALRDHYGHHLSVGAGWIASGQSLIVRYEAMQRDTFAEMKRLTEQIAPVAEATIREAIAASTPNAMRAQSEFLARHVRSATIGDSRNQLSESHLAIFRDQHADLVRQLGYDVR